MPATENSTRLPSVDLLLRDKAFSGLMAEFGHIQVRDAIRAVLSDLRAAKKTGSVRGIADAVSRALHGQHRVSLRPVFNLSGTILHTNLGRAPLPQTAIDAMIDAAGAVNLEYDLISGDRGQRDSHVEAWLVKLTGAQAAIAVNNNAAAVMLCLNTLAQGQEVVTSRGELIEIGGAFRMPDIIESAGCDLREVGTTNRTHIGDYEKAVSAATAAILRVHTSNYKVEGFSFSVPEAELAELARKSDIPFVVDLGSGSLVDLATFGLPAESTVRLALQNGADLVTFSGDKLLGGPQAGIIAGRADLIAKIAENPMKRAMRLDKITIAALAAVLRLYGNPSVLADHLPTLRLLSRKADDISAQAARLRPSVAKALDGIATVEVQPCRSQIGSGAMPVDLLDSAALVLTPRGTRDQDLRDLAAALRATPRPVIGRVHNGAVYLDLRALEDEPEFLVQLKSVADLAAKPDQ